MHRKKFLSFLGMAAVAAPILAKEIPQAKEVKTLELSEGFIGMGKAQQSDFGSVTTFQGNVGTVKGIVVTPSSTAVTGGSILIWNGSEFGWQEQEYKDPFDGFKVYHSTYIP